MIVRAYKETDGKCFADSEWGCEAMTGYHKKCGTYQCTFYKPIGCEDWVKIEHENCIKLYSPREYYNAKENQLEG